ncbi:MAG TPA: DNA phosphorothioation-dependent restriction protein DptF [Mucilaginibacter sp.]|jgi:DNA phosphorothioation-dependent restriction protein DptF
MFKSLLDKLSISSKEAVVDGNSNSFNEFKTYLHLNRFVEQKFEEIVSAAVKSPLPQLILLSGNVGDGKSHILSRMFMKYPEEMKQVKVRNDATESRDVNKDWVMELRDFLSPFTSENLKDPNNSAKRIVAINLGVLSSFLNLSKEDFPELAQFVYANGIIDRVSLGNKFDEKCNFQFINFADYNLFTLLSDKANSALIYDLLKKVTNPADSNPFFYAFNQYYYSHPNSDACPMRFNYLQLSKGDVQEGLANLVIHAIIKFKLILSVRDLLDFLYNLIVPAEFAPLTGEEIKELFVFGKNPKMMPNILYNVLFDNAGKSELFDSLTLLDPVRYRSFTLDNLIFKVSSTNNPEKLFEEFGLDFNFTWLANQNPLLDKPLIVKTFIRSLFLNKNQFFKEELNYYYLFTKYLFAYYTGDKKGLLPLYRDLIKSIYYWNGNSKLDKEVNIPIGKKQLEYNITQSILLKADVIIQEGISATTEVNEFDTTFPIGIIVNNDKLSFKLDIDLFVLLQNVIKGYSPNRLDRESHVNFQQSIDQMTVLAGQDQSINFERLGGSTREKFQLSFDPSFGYEFFKL